MSSPDYCAQSQLFSIAAISTTLFPPDDPYRLLAKLIYPVLVAARPIWIGKVLMAQRTGGLLI
jgi:hypothetical protein